MYCMHGMLVNIPLQSYTRARCTDQCDRSTIIDQNLKAASFFNEEAVGPVDQSGMIAAFARRKPRVQIPPGPPPFGYKSQQFYMTLPRI